MGLPENEKNISYRLSMEQILNDDSFFQAPEPGVIQQSAPNRAVRVKLDPILSHAREGRAELHPVVQEQARKVRDALLLLEQQAEKMRKALQTLEHHPLENRRASDRNNVHGRERRRAHRAEPEDPNQLYLFDQELLKPKYSAPPAVLPTAVDGVSIENFSISLAYGDDGMGLVGATLVALASGDSNGDGIINSQDHYPDNSPVTRLNIDLNLLREGMMEKVRELVTRFDVNGNGRLDGPSEAFAFLHHIAQLELVVDSSHVDKRTGMITTESYVKAFGECLNRGLPETPKVEE